MSQSGAKAKVQWWIFGLLLLVHVVQNVNPYWVDSVVVPQEYYSVNPLDGWPFDCTGDTHSQRRPIYLFRQIIANFAIAICSSWGASVCASPAILYCYSRFRWRAIAALAATIFVLICFPKSLELPSLPLPSKLIYRVSDLLNCVTWSFAILGVYWPLSYLVSTVKRFSRLKDGQFNLSMVLIGVTAASILFAFVGRQLRSQRAQLKAVNYFSSYGYILTTEADYLDYRRRRVVVPMPGKTWRDWEAVTGVSRYLLASRDGLYRVVDFEVGDKGVRESEIDWGYLRSLPYLQMIEVSRRSQDNGEMFAELANCRHLVCICATDCDIHDDDLKVLASDSKLKRLHLSGSPITDKSVGYLLRLINLRALDITGTKISKQGVQQLKEGLPNCSVLRYDQQDHEVIENPIVE